MISWKKPFLTGAGIHSSFFIWCSIPSKIIRGSESDLIPGFLLKRLEMGNLWDPGTYQRQPFSRVASSMGNQRPTYLKYKFRYILIEIHILGAVHIWYHLLRREGETSKRWRNSMSLFSKMGDKGEGRKSLKMYDVIYG